MPDSTTADWAALLTQPERARTAGVFVAEGRIVLARTLACLGPGAILHALATPAAAAALRLEATLGNRLVVVSPAEMQAVTGFNFHRGVLAVVRRPPSRTARDVVLAATGAGRRPVFVAAEHLVDVDNVGGCFRNAHAFGAAGVLLDDRCPDPLYRKAIRTSLGAVLQVPWAQAPMAEVLAVLAGEGVHAIALMPAAPATLAEVLAERAGSGALAVVVGNEGAGLSEATLAACSSRASIPMATGADSVNVATAVAIALYEIAR